MSILTPQLNHMFGTLTRLGGYTTLGAHQEETVSGTAIELSEPRPIEATGLLIQTVDADIQFTIDGTDPTATPGFVLYQNQLPLYIPLLQNNVFTVVRDATTDASVRYQWVAVEG